MSRDDLVAGLVWRKSSFSGGGGNSGGECVELATAHDGRIAVRDSKNPQAGFLLLPRDRMAAFLRACTSGELDHVTG
ncbi:DUF397 domain-containing protein [Pseudonocardia sp. HH130630-07]|uniref:DUF397 domain-containing protein n=1 Tax=Pseudonocardia sp. HH130630-07 TaxID=1690815 RepID=UPI000815384B|nr:DUF397 domain-containing protein [Pseudonocardia sp. HH130630-07]ANY09309.1 DUF397 domain-containing protein [Pseudonocardia sp. HH130630-07]